MADADSFEIIDDEADQTDEDRRLREVRVKRQSLRKSYDRRGRDLLAAAGVTLLLSGLYALVLAFPKFGLGNTAGGVVMSLIGLAFIGGGTFMLNNWRRGR